MFTSGVRKVRSSEPVALTVFGSFLANVFIDSFLSVLSCSNSRSALDLDLLWFGLFGFGKDDGQQAILVRGLHVISIYGGRQSDRSMKAPNKTFVTIRFTLFIFLFALAFAGKREDSVLQGDFDILFLHPRQLRL